MELVNWTSVDNHAYEAMLLLSEEDADCAADSSAKGKQATFPKSGEEPPAQRFVTSEPWVPVWFDKVATLIEMFKFFL